MEMRLVLYPLEITHRNAARIGKHIGHDKYALVAEDIIGLGGSGAVGNFDNDFGVALVRIALVELVFLGRGDPNINITLSKFYNVYFLVFDITIQPSVTA